MALSASPAPQPSRSSDAASGAAPLVVTRDEALLEELLRLAAAAGVSPELVSDPGAALRVWSGAPLVLVGADAVGQVAALAPDRRPGVLVVGLHEVPHEVFPAAIAVAAEHVLDLARSAQWLAERLGELEDSLRAPGRLLAVVGGSGGAGATTFACALAQVAARGGPALAVDADPLGPGLDRVLGLDGLDGIRWDALQQTTGRISARALREALPRRGPLGVLTWHAGATASLPAFAVREALASGRRGHDTVVVDLPRHGDPVVEEVVARADALLVVAVPSVAGVASAARLCAGLAGGHAAGLVLRGSGVDEREAARVSGLPVWATMPDQRGLAEALDLGLGPVRSRRGPLGRTATAVLAALTSPAVAA